MPLFHRKSEEEKQSEAHLKDLQQQHEADQAESMRRLQQGGLPVQATRRLEEMAKDPRHLFSSDLKVSELFLTRHRGLEPITQVMGSAFYHIGWQGLYTSWMSQEMSVISEAYRNARRLALGRLSQEAEMVGANAVIGVRLKDSRYEWGSNTIEFTAIGTAVRLAGAPAGGRPALSNLSGQEFYKLVDAGYWPVGVAAGVCVFYQVATWATQSLNWWGGGFANQELTDFTRGMMAARALASQDLSTEADRLGGHGVVGMSIEDRAQEHEVDTGNDTHRTDMIFTFTALGTAICPLVHSPKREPITMVKPLAGRGKSRQHAHAEFEENQI